MLTITPALRKHMVETFALKADATDDDIRKSVMEALTTGIEVGGTRKSLDAAKLAELSTVKASEAEQKVKSMIDAAMAPVMDAIKALAPAGAAGAAGGAKAGTADGTTAGGAPVETKATNLNGGTGANPAPAGGAAGGTPANGAEKAYAMSAAAGGSAASGLDEQTRVRVKSILEQFNDSRTSLTWDKSSKPHVVKALGATPITAHCEGLPYSIDVPTDRMKVIAGVWFKHMGLSRLRMKGHSVQQHWRLKEWEQDVLKHIAHECRFIGGGFADGFEYDGEKLASDLHVKAVLDDSTSGGLEAVPIEFDAAVILTPLLNGELFPFVNITNVGRRRIEATKIGNPTMSWGPAEGTSISLFNTDSFISAFDNNIYPITGAIEIGLDFLADSPLAVAGIIINRYGERFRQEMDNVIATGDGTTQPEGWFTTSGVATVTPSGGAGGAQTVGDYEQLRFGVAKEFRQEAGNRAMYIATDTSYSRARGIAVDSSSDQRRVFGIVDQEDYMLFGRRYAINESLTNAQIGYFCMNRYRMYRRQGLEMRLVTEDWTLARQNKEGLVVRARFGGAPELAAAGAKITAGQA